MQQRFLRLKFSQGRCARLARLWIMWSRRRHDSSCRRNHNVAGPGRGASTPALPAFDLRYRRGNGHRRDGLGRKRQQNNCLILLQDDVSLVHRAEHPAIVALSRSQPDRAIGRLIKEYADGADLAGDRTDEQKRRPLALGRFRLRRRRCRGGDGDDWRRGRAPRRQKKWPILRRRQVLDRYRPQRIVEARLIGGTGLVRLPSICYETCQRHVGLGVRLPDNRYGDGRNATACR